MKSFVQTALTSIDSYKTGHADQYPEGTTKVYSNLTPRSLNYLKTANGASAKHVVWFGLQAFLCHFKKVWQETFFDRPFEEVAEEFSEIVAPFCGPRAFDLSRLEWLHKLGYLPLEIKALPEGLLVPAGVPVITITNTLPEAYWLPNFSETWLSSDLWKSSTTATISYNYRKIIDHYAEVTGGSKEFVMWQGHDFSSRGMSGMQDVAISGAGHLLSFAGTDNVTAVKLINDVYRGKETFIGGSVPATEHSVSCANILMLLEDEELLQKIYDQELKHMIGKNIIDYQTKLFVAEYQFIKRLITKIYPSGVVSVVSDSFDFWKVITVIAPALKHEIESRIPDSLGLAKVVFRPDSGDPVKIVCGYKFKKISSIFQDYDLLQAQDEGYEFVYVEDEGKYYSFEGYDDGWSTKFDYDEIPEHEVKGAIECLWDTFGGTVNDKGYRTLNQRVGLIYGDSITMQRCNDILKLLAEKGFASDNVVFGIGSFTFQYNTRDTCGFAMKATYVEVKDKAYSIFKAPKTDSGTKKSARGLLQVVRQDGELKMIQDVTWEQEKQGLLRSVFLNGEILVDESYADIRSRLGVI